MMDIGTPTRDWVFGDLASHYLQLIHPIMPLPLHVLEMIVTCAIDEADFDFWLKTYNRVHNHGPHTMEDDLKISWTNTDDGPEYQVFSQ